MVSGSCTRRKGSQDTLPDRAAKRQRAPENQGHFYAQVADSALTMVFVSSGYPHICLIALELDKLRMEISKAIDALPREGRALKFDDTHLRARAIFVWAADFWTLEWLVRMAPTSRLKEGLETSFQGSMLRSDTQAITTTEAPPVRVQRVGRGGGARCPCFFFVALARKNDSSHFSSEARSRRQFQIYERCYLRNNTFFLIF